MTDRRNVVLVSVDSVRADHCGFMGYDRDTTPTLDAMAETGLRYEHAISPGPSTYDSMPAVFTGRRMAPHTVGETFEGDTLDRKTENIARNMHGETLAEWFDRQGYATGAFTTNPYTGEHTAFARGFDQYEDFMDGGEGTLMQKAAHVPVFAELKHLVTLVRGDRASMRWSEYYQDIVEWVRDAPEPYFLWIFLLDTHTPYLVDGEYRSETGPLGMYYHNWKLWMAKKWLDSDGSSLDRDSLVSLYDDAIRATDAFLDRLLVDLGDTDPAVVVHADHGEAFGEHGTYGHQGTLYEENVHVPLVVHGGAAEGVERRPTSLTRLPAILRAVATDRDPRDGATDRPDIATATTWDGRRFAVRGRTLKYIATVAPETGALTEEAVYDLASDGAEQRNLATDYPNVVDACRALLRRRRSHDSEVTGVAARAAGMSAELVEGEEG